MSTDYLDQRAVQLKDGKNIACRRAVDKILAMMKKRIANGEYFSAAEAELDLIRFLERESSCSKPICALKTTTYKKDRGKCSSKRL
jgi:hypothetical protein